MRHWKQLEGNVHYMIVISPLLVWVHGNVDGPGHHGNTFEPQQYLAEIVFSALPISQSVSQQYDMPGNQSNMKILLQAKTIAFKSITRSSIKLMCSGSWIKHLFIRH